MSYRSLILLIALGLAGSQALAQRVFKTINPNTGTEVTYKFDTNNVRVGQETLTPDINFPPNIVFTPDSSKGFVAYPGSDKILVFAPATGEILGTVATPRNPVNLTLTPDAKKIAVPCLFLKDNSPQKDNLLGKRIGTIAIIDVDTLAVQTIDLTQVQFSFANNIVFSADSKTGYVASSATDEILRFDLDTATEITPRLAVNLGLPSGSTGRMPQSLTMAADHSFFTVVLVGSTFVVRRDHPDTIAIIDPATWSVRTTIDTQVASDDLPYDFQPINTVGLTKDGKYGLICDRAFSITAGSNAYLVNDRALLFDVTTAKIVKTFGIGYSPSAVFASPDGTRFMVVSEIYVATIDPVKQEVASVSPIFADFKPGTRVAFTPDSKKAYVPVPVGLAPDYILVFSMESGAVTRFTDVGVRVQPELAADDPNFGIQGAPLEVAMTPNGQVLASLNFNLNTIDLIRDTTSFAIPLFFHSDPWFTGVALTNNGTTEATIKTIAYSRGGAEYQDLTSTTDKVEYTNPNTIKLAPGQQTAFTAAGLLKPTTGNTIEGWLDVDTDVPQTSSFFLVGDSAIKRLDGAPAFIQLSTTVIVPEVRVTDNFRTELTIFNYTWSENPFVMTLYSEEGKKLFSVDSSTATVYGGIELNGFVRDPDGTASTYTGMFPESAFENFTNGYIVIAAKYPLMAIERYYDNDRLSVVYGFPWGSNFNTEKRLYIPQVAMFGDSATFLNLINSGTETATITAVLKDNNGQTVGTAATLQLEAGKQQRRSIAQIFQLIDPGQGQTISGWIQLDSDKPGIIGDAEIQAFTGKAMTTIPVTTAAGNKLVFSHVAQGLGYSTGISLLNPGQAAASAHIEVFAPDGTREAEKQVSIPAGGRLVNMLSDAALFPELNDRVGGYIRVTSDQSLIGLEIFFTNNLELLSLVPAQVLP